MFILRFTRRDSYQQKEFGVDCGPGEAPERTSHTLEAEWFTKQEYTGRIVVTHGVDGKEPRTDTLDYKTEWSALYVMNEAGDTIERLVAPVKE